jgi:hypothetical protein
MQDAFEASVGGRKGRPGVVGRFLVLGCLLSLLGCGDAAQLSNTSGSENGILVDGQQSAGFQNDRTFTSSDAKIAIGQFTAAPGEVVAFTNFRPVAITTPVNWSTSDETAAVPFAARIQIPVKVWIVQGPFAAQRDLAIDHCITTSGIWNSERMGVDFSPFEIVDATGDPDAPNYVAFDCSKRAGIQTDIGRTAGRINIYWVNTVDGGTGRGQACSIGSDFVAMGSATGTELLSHELGHDFALQHIDGQASFDQTNTMHSASNTREFITEGQLFRAHLRTDSALNSVYAARPGLPTRNCAHGDATNTCLALMKRIWADGAFPAN